MELTLWLLCFAGAWLVWWRPSRETHAAAAKEADFKRTTGTKCSWQKKHWAGLVVLSAILTIAAFQGWWATELLYGEQVIYSYDTQGMTEQK